MCPACNASTRVAETRAADRGRALRRRRHCPDCGHRFTTFERIERAPLKVRKRDGELQRFDRLKLRAALLGAAHKRPVAAPDLERIVERVESAAEADGGEIGAERIGELCLAGLSDLDRGAFFQYAGTLPNFEPGNYAFGDAPSDTDSVRDARDPAQLPAEPTAKGANDD